jgi:PAS domain S-box-containing protein
VHSYAAPVVSPHGKDMAFDGTSGAEARLALAESFLSSPDVEFSAHQALDWLAACAGIDHSLVALVDAASPALLCVAERGASETSRGSFTLSRDDRNHPVIAAMDRDAPTFFPAHATLGTPFEGTAFHALPLRSEERAATQGLLLTAASSPEPHPDLCWVARLLSKQVARQFGPIARGESGFGQERMLLYSIINAVTDPILLTDTEGKLIIANTHAEKLFAATEAASEGKRRAVALNNMLFSAALSTSAVTQSELARRELLLVDPVEGSDLLFELLSSRAKDERQGTFVVSILRNITDLANAREEIEESYRTLRLAQAEVRDERHRLDLIIDSVADPILVTDPEGDIVLLNTPAERLFSVPATADESAQRSVRANGANLTSFVSNVLTRTGEQRYRGEIQLTDPTSGRALPVEALAGTILTEQGELVWVVTILHDLTEALEKEVLYERLKQASLELERKIQEATAELAQQNELLRRQHIELEQASALKSQFLANISHEFRTPLNAILGYTHMLLHGVTGAVTDPQRKSLTRIDSNSRHLLALINDILDITRIEAGRMPLTVTRFSLAELLGEVRSELEPIIRKSNLEVTIKRPPPALPLVKTDRQKVKQIVLNLLSNALKFTPTGSVRIATSFDRKNQVVSVVVRDTGVGIPEESQNKIFEDFRQLDNSPTRRYGGTGLGLSICRRLAQMLGGSIELVSNLGEGSTFTLRLPVRGRRR